MKFDLLVSNGEVVTTAGVRKINIGICSGKIAALISPGLDVEAVEVIDASGTVVLPGLIDVHVHGGYGDPDRETLSNVSMAAAAGGITTIFDQPLSNPSTVTLDRVKAKKEAAEKACVVDFSLWGGLVPGHFDDLEAMYAYGAQAFKAFMCRCSNYPMTPDGLLLKGMHRVGELGGLVAVHAENDTLIQQLVDDFQAAGRNDVSAFLESHPVYSELEAIERFIFLSRLAPKCKTHIVHMSIPEGAKAIKRARGEGLTNLSVETCPQYLALSDKDLYELGGVAKCDPPVRPPEAVDELWQYVLDGTIDLIASDHSPHSFQKKTPVNGNFWPVSEGVTGVQTMLPAVVTAGQKHGLTWERVAELMSTNPAKRFGLFGRKGAIEIGFDADLVLVDPNDSWVLREDDLYYLNRHSPFVGKTFNCKVKQTIVRGTTVYKDGAICVKPGFGRYYPMEMR